MKKIFTAILLIFICHNVFSQIKVKENSFHQIEGFVMLDKNDHYDDNNRPMALIKIATENIKAEERRKFIFKGNMATYFDVHFEPGEIWLYLSTEATFIEIIHDDFGKTEFVLPYDLKDFCGYEMVVQYVPLTPQTEPEHQKKFHLIVKADRPESIIYIDNKLIGTGETSILVDEGTTHTYKIECELYHTESGSVTVNDKMTIDKTLRPAFGYINISTSPEQGARVYVDGKYLGVSPVKSDKLSSGTHTVRVMKDMYKMKEQSFTVIDGQTTNANVTMEANFVTLTVNTDADAEIYVDEEYKGKGRWTGRISEGSHIFEVRKQNHKPTKKTIDLVLGENKTIALEAPKPISGSIEISSSPMEANIYIDDKSYGTTPNYINEILIGTHELKLTKQGCAPITKTINVKEGETLIVNEMLQTAKEMSISTDKSGDKIYVDDKYVGLSPVTTSLAYGSHNVKAERNGKTVSKTVSVSQNSSNNIVKLLFGKEVTIESEQNGDAVYIDGKRVGTTSFKTYLTYGTYTVKLSRGTQSITENIEVSEYGPSTFKMEIGQTIQINSTKKGDKVFVDGKKVGNTPLQLNLSLGQHSVLVKRGKKTDREYIYLKGELNQKYNFYPSRDYPFWSAVGGAFSDVGYFFGGVFEDMGYFFGNMFEGCYFSVNGGIKSFMDSDKNYFSYGLDFGGFFFDEFGIFASTSKWQYSWSILGGFNFDMSIFGVEYEGVIGRIGAGYTFSLSPDNYVQGVEYLAGVAIGEEGVFFNYDFLTTNFETLEMRVGLGWRW